MSKSLLAIFIFLFLAGSLAHGHNSPYAPGAGVYAIERNNPKNHKQQKYPGYLVTPSRRVKAAPKTTNGAIYPIIFDNTTGGVTIQ